MNTQLFEDIDMGFFCSAGHTENFSQLLNLFATSGEPILGDLKKIPLVVRTFYRTIASPFLIIQQLVPPTAALVTQFTVHLFANVCQFDAKIPNLSKKPEVYTMHFSLSNALFQDFSPYHFKEKIAFEEK